MAGPGFSLKFGPLLRAIRGLKFARVLDVGCGSGELARGLLARGIARLAVGVDKKATKPRPGAGWLFVRGRAESLPFRDGAFDLVVSTFAVHEFDDQYAGLKEMARVLRPGGLLVCLDWTKGAPVALGQNPLRPGEFENLLEAAGLSVRRVTRLRCKKVLVVAARSGERGK